MQFVSVTSQVSFLSTSFHKKVKKYKEKPHLSKGKESTYLFGQSLIILLNENFVEEKDYKSMLWKISLVFLLVLCSAYTRHLCPCCDWTNEDSLAAAFRNSRQNRQNIQGGKTVCASFCASLIAGSRCTVALCNNRRTLQYLSHFVIKLSHFVITVALCNNTCRTL